MKPFNDFNFISFCVFYFYFNLLINGIKENCYNALFNLTKLSSALLTLSELKYKKNALVSFTDSIFMIMEILEDTSTPSKPILWAKWEIGGKIDRSKNLFSLLSTRQHQSENPTSEMCLRNESTSNNRNKKSLTKENGSSISSLPDGPLCLFLRLPLTFKEMHARAAFLLFCSCLCADTHYSVHAEINKDKLQKMCVCFDLCDFFV